MVVQQASMADYTTFHIGGDADWFITAPGEEAAARVLRACRETDTPLLFLGNGSNLLVADAGIRGVVLRLAPDAGAPRREGDTVICPAGMPLKQLCRYARDEGLAGLEFAYGIPGTVGGAVYMNAGAYGGQIADVLTVARVLTDDGTVREVPAAQLALGYRHSALMESGGIVTQAAFTLCPDDREAIAARMEEFMRRRREKQPLEYPSAGSFFKRPPGQFAGTLIEGCGLKGLTVGGAQVSEKHAGFLINRGGATCADVLALARRVQETVYVQRGVRLEREVRTAGYDEPGAV